MGEPFAGISAFVQAVEAGGFAQAAVRLNQTRSAVGKSIARLESRLGVRLFQRTTRRQSLTEDGEAYYERCTRALAELDAADAALDHGRREPVGRLKITAPVLFGRRCVAPVLVCLVNQHPKLMIEMSFSDRVTDLVEEGFDLAVRVGPLRDSDSLVARRLSTQRMGICAAPAYLARHGHPANLDNMRGHVGVVYGRGGTERLWSVKDTGGQTREVRVEARLRFDDLQAIADAALAGVGLAWLPCWLIAAHVASGELVMVFDSTRVMSTEIHAVWPQTRHLSSKMRVAIDALAAGIPTEG